MPLDVSECRPVSWTVAPPDLIAVIASLSVEGVSW